MFKSLRQIVQTLVILWVGSVCCSCSSIADARQTVAQADSLRAIGQAFTDSTAIATVVEALSPVRLLYPTDYARANYYYGRLLREHNDHPAAMQAFLRVVHSCTHDHAIKARAYSNIANMCRLATSHELAYKIYEHAADEFLKANDSIMYFYVLNNMAHERANGKKCHESLAIISKVENECNDENVLTKLWETRAVAYLYNEDYDSTIYCTNQLLSRGYTEATGLLLKAQAFSFLNIKDSAVYYAQLALSKTASWFDINNAYYILANDDQNNTKEDALQIAGDRADIQKLIEIRRGELAQATQLLQQDLYRKPDLRWLFAVIFTLMVISIALTLYVRRKRRQHRLYSQQVDDLQQKKNKLSEHTKHLEVVHSEYEGHVRRDVEQFCQRILADSNPQESISWNDYDKMRETINTNLFHLADKLEELGLAPHEIKFCVLVLLQFNRKECARWMNLGVSSMGGKKRDIAKKLGQTSSHLYGFLLSLALK